MSEKIYVSSIGAINAKKALVNAEIQNIPLESKVACYGAIVTIKKLHPEDTGATLHLAIANKEDQDYLNSIGAVFPMPTTYATIGSALANSVIGKSAGDENFVDLPQNRGYPIRIEEVKMINYLFSKNEKE